MIDRIATWALAAALTILPAHHAGAQEADSPEIRRALAGQLSVIAFVVLDNEPLSVEAVESATILIQSALRITPEDEELVRFALRLATLREDQAWRKELLLKIRALEPADDVVQLALVNLEIEEIQTAEDRIDRYRSLLRATEEFGPALRSRLALDLALLYRRQGDLDHFAESLAEAASLDSSNRAAAAMAAGFYRVNVDDPIAQAELLLNLLLADPTDRTTAAALGTLLASHGATRGAERMLRIAVELERAQTRQVDTSLLADLSIMMWANGEADAAALTIREQQRVLEEQLRLIAQQRNPDLTPGDRAKLTAVVAPAMMVVRAAIAIRQEHEEAPTAVREALFMYESRIDALSKQADQEGADQAAIAREIASMKLESAWMALFLGADLEAAEIAITQASADHPLTDVASARLAGWVALRRGATEQAVALLEPVAAGDSLAALGLAMAYDRVGRRRDAARQFLAVARMSPATVAGVHATLELERLLGQRVPISDTAARLEALLDDVPVTLDQIPRNASVAVEVRLQPASLTFAPFAPCTLLLEIHNRSSVPLAIDRGGPIFPQVVMEIESSFARQGLQPEVEALVVDIDRRLRIEPRQTLEIPVVATRSRLGQAMTEYAIQGTLLRFTAYTNAQALPTSNGFRTLPLGSTVSTPALRVEGIRSTGSALDQVIDIAHTGRDMDLVTALVVLAQRLADELSAEATNEQRRQRERALDALNEGERRLTESGRALFVGLVPPGRLMESVAAHAKASTDPLVRMTYLMTHVVDSTDAYVSAALTAEDEGVRKLAELVRGRAEWIEQLRRRQGVTRGLLPSTP